MLRLGWVPPGAGDAPELVTADGGACVGGTVPAEPLTGREDAREPSPVPSLVAVADGERCICGVGIDM